MNLKVIFHPWEKNMFLFDILDIPPLLYAKAKAIVFSAMSVPEEVLVTAVSLH